MSNPSEAAVRSHNALTDVEEALRWADVNSDPHAKTLASELRKLRTANERLIAQEVGQARPANDNSLSAVDKLGLAVEELTRLANEWRKPIGSEITAGTKNKCADQVEAVARRLG